MYNTCVGSIRYNKIAIDILEEYGSEKCSGPNAHLIVETINTKYSIGVDEYDGKETAYINFDKWLHSQVEKLDIENVSLEELKSKIVELKKECALNPHEDY